MSSSYQYIIQSRKSAACPWRKRATRRTRSKAATVVRSMENNNEIRILEIRTRQISAARI